MDGFQMLKEEKKVFNPNQEEKENIKVYGYHLI